MRRWRHCSRKLLGVARVAVISGGAFPQFQKQLVANLPPGGDLEKLSLLPTNGTRFYQYEGGTGNKLYAEDLTPDQKQRIIAALKRGDRYIGIPASKTWGEAIEDRDSQITYSALGQQAPLEAKKSWDPDFAKRKKIKSILDAIAAGLCGEPRRSDLDRRHAARASTKPTASANCAIFSSIPIAEMLYVGDALFPGGNDYPVRSTGTACIQIRDPNETKRVIEAVVACLE